MSIQKRIGFKDIQVGDTIRVVDIIDVKITNVDVRFEIKGEANGRPYVILDHRPNWEEGKRSFQLLERPIEPLPTEVGSAIKFDGSIWFLSRIQYASNVAWYNANTGEIITQPTMEGRVRIAGGFDRVA